MKVVAAAAILSVVVFSSPAQCGLITESTIINNWSSVSAVSVSGSTASWQQFSNTIAPNGNRTGGLVSDFVSSGDFSFSTTVRPNGDNDHFGILFGYQDSDNSYGLSWGRGGIGFDGVQLFRESGGVRSVLANSNARWSPGVSYHIGVTRVGNTISADIKKGAASIFSESVTDASFSSGRVGFEVWSQNASFSFGQTDYTDLASATVPEPSSAIAFALIGLVAINRRRKIN